MKNNFFVKSHGLGNEYVVFDSESITFEINENSIKKICNVNFGIGSDGLLLKVPGTKADFGIRIFNPDGSEAEKSGNGIRIFSKYLYDYKLCNSRHFTIETRSGIVSAEIIELKNNKAKIIKIDMGKASFRSKDIPVNTYKSEYIDECLKVEDKEYKINCVSVGNPHCVIIRDKLDIGEIKKYGVLIENNRLFPNRINVQFVKPINRKEVEILIWERGAGFTLASGSSSCAVASVMVKKGLTDNNLKVKMIGGSLDIEVDNSWNIKMTGEVKQIAEGFLSEEFVEEL